MVVTPGGGGEPGILGRCGTAPGLDPEGQVTRRMENELCCPGPRCPLRHSWTCLLGREEVPGPGGAMSGLRHLFTCAGRKSTRLAS